MIMEHNDPDDDLIELDKYTTIADAYIVKGILETNGVPCVINGQLMSTLYFGVPGLDTRLYVRKKDLDIARKILASKPASDSVNS